MIANVFGVGLVVLSLMAGTTPSAVLDTNTTGAASSADAGGSAAGGASGAGCPAPCLAAGPVQLPGGLGDPVPTSSGMGFSTISTGFNGAEPTIGVSDDGTTIYIQQGLNTARSTNSGSTWTEIGPPLTNVVTLDPMMYYDPVINRLYINHLTVECTVLAWNDSPQTAVGGAAETSWRYNPHACGAPGIDHQKLEGGPSPLLGTANEGRSLYMAYSEAGGGAVVAKSVDGGLTWINVVAGNALTRGTVLWPTGTVTADPAGTFVYLPYHSPNGLRVATSANEGLTYSNSLISNSAGASGHAVDPEVAVDSAGTAYVVYWSDTDYQLYYSYSTNNGGAWSTPTAITSSSTTDSTVYPTAVALSPGSVDVAFYATPDSTAGPDGCSNSGASSCHWYLYMAQITDADTSTPTITVTQITPSTDPIQVGKICTGGTGCSGNTRNLLDFIDIEVDSSGYAHIAYTDGCVGSCSGSSTGQSTAAAGKYARQTSGTTI